MILLLSLTFLQTAAGGLLGYGTGEGSCAAPPFRAHEVQWGYGCPPFAPCCSEYGFCRPLEEWEYGNFRDCNGVSNGTPLPPETIEAEAAAGHYNGEPAGKIGPPPDVIRSHHPKHSVPHPIHTYIPGDHHLQHPPSSHLKPLLPHGIHASAHGNLLAHPPPLIQPYQSPSITHPIVHHPDHSSPKYNHPSPPPVVLKADHGVIHPTGHGIHATPYPVHHPNPTYRPRAIHKSPPYNPPAHKIIPTELHDNNSYPQASPVSEYRVPSPLPKYGAPPPVPEYGPTPSVPEYGAPPQVPEYGEPPKKHAFTHIGSPKPHIGHPQPHIGHHQQHIGHPQPHIGHPQPHTGHPTPHIGHPQHSIAHPQPHISHPQPHIGHTQQHIGHHQPHIGHPQHHIVHPQHLIAHPQHKIVHPEPSVAHPPPPFVHPHPHIGHPQSHISQPAPHFALHQAHISHPPSHIAHTPVNIAQPAPKIIHPPPLHQTRPFVHHSVRPNPIHNNPPPPPVVLKKDHSFHNNLFKPGHSTVNHVNPPVVSHHTPKLQSLHPVPPVHLIGHPQSPVHPPFHDFAHGPPINSNNVPKAVHLGHSPPHFSFQGQPNIFHPGPIQHPHPVIGHPLNPVQHALHSFSGTPQSHEVISLHQKPFVSFGAPHQKLIPGNTMSTLELSLMNEQDDMEIPMEPAERKSKSFNNDKQDTSPVMIQSKTKVIPTVSHSVSSPIVKADIKPVTEQRTLLPETIAPIRMIKSENNMSPKITSSPFANLILTTPAPRMALTPEPLMPMSTGTPTIQSPPTSQITGQQPMFKAPQQALTVTVLPTFTPAPPKMMKIDRVESSSTGKPLLDPSMSTNSASSFSSERFQEIKQIEEKDESSGTLQLIIDNTQQTSLPFKAQSGLNDEERNQKSIESFAPKMEFLPITPEPVFQIFKQTNPLTTPKTPPVITSQEQSIKMTPVEPSVVTSQPTLITPLQISPFSGQRLPKSNQQRLPNLVTSQPTFIPTPEFRLLSGSQFSQFNQPISVTSQPSLIRPQQSLTLSGQKFSEFNQQRQPKGLEVKPSEINSIVLIPASEQVQTLPLVAVNDNQQPDTRCQHPVAGGSYTCISFGHPHKPIFAYHTLHDLENGFVFGTGSGFQNETVYNALDTTRTRRRIMKKQLEKEFMNNLRKKKLMKQETRSNEQKNRNISQSQNLYNEQNHIEVKINNNKRRKVKKKMQERVEMKTDLSVKHVDNNSVGSNEDDQHKSSPFKSLQKEMFQTDFDDQEQSTIPYQIITSRPRVQPYEYPLTEITPSTNPLLPKETHEGQKQPKRRLPSNFNQLSDLGDESP